VECTISAGFERFARSLNVALARPLLSAGLPSPVIARAIDFAGLKRENPRLLLQDEIPCNRFARYSGCALVRCGLFLKAERARGTKIPSAPRAVRR